MYVYCIQHKLALRKTKLMVSYSATCKGTWQNFNRILKETRKRAWYDMFSMPTTQQSCRVRVFNNCHCSKNSVVFPNRIIPLTHSEQETSYYSKVSEA